MVRRQEATARDTGAAAPSPRRHHHHPPRRQLQVFLSRVVQPSAGLCAGDSFLPLPSSSSRPACKAWSCCPLQPVTLRGPEQKAALPMTHPPAVCRRRRHYSPSHRQSVALLSKRGLVADAIAVLPAIIKLTPAKMLSLHPLSSPWTSGATLPPPVSLGRPMLSHP